MNRKLLILDVDETLIHGSEQPLDRPADFVCDWCHLYKRPYVEAFMDFCREHFRLAVWSSASRDHIDMALEQIGAADFPFEFVWGVERCSNVLTRPDDCVHAGMWHWRKDLKKVKRRGYDLTQVIMLDDSPEKLDRHYGNLLRIRPFHGEPEDRELLRVMPYLLELKEAENIRAIEKRGWEARFTPEEALAD